MGLKTEVNARLFFLLSFVASVIAGLLFVPGLGGGFVFDDIPNIVENPAIQIDRITSVNDLAYAAFSYGAGSGARSLAMLSFALDYFISGLAPVSFKFTNIVIHCLTCFSLSFFFFRVMNLAGMPVNSAKWAGLFLALIWAVHPLQVSSVLYVVQRMQTLATFFVVLSLLSYLKMRCLQIDGEKGRSFGIAAILFGVLAFACKEDAVLLPVYFAVLELTLLRFKADSPSLVKGWKRLYLAGGVTGFAVYMFLFVPEYWSWEAYPGRNFSSIERLMTQGRVLIMYIGQCIFPVSNLMPFNYDSLVVSRSLVEPWTTLPSLILVFGLLAWAWIWRNRNPLFSLGLLLFFSGHIITSNILSLELAFEHRNHFPLIGILLSVSGLISSFIKREGGSKNRIVSIVAVAMLFLVSASTYHRAYAWGDPIRLAEHNLQLDNSSERAWLFLCASHFRMASSHNESDGMKKVIKVCQDGADTLPDSVLLMSNVLIFKGKNGQENAEDWERLLRRLRLAPMSKQNIGVLWVILLSAERGDLKNEKGILEAVDIIAGQASLRSRDYLRVAAFIFNETHEPRKAFPYLERAVEKSSMSDPAIIAMLNQLRSAGLQSWVDRLEENKKGDRSRVNNHE